MSPSPDLSMMLEQDQSHEISAIIPVMEEEEKQTANQTNMNTIMD